MSMKTSRQIAAEEKIGFMDASGIHKDLCDHLTDKMADVSIRIAGIYAESGELGPQELLASMVAATGELLGMQIASMYDDDLDTARSFVKITTARLSERVEERIKKGG